MSEVAETTDFWMESGVALSFQTSANKRHNELNRRYVWGAAGR